MNPSTALGRVVVDELVRAGVHEAVLAPGSRSAPVALALHDADVAGRLRLHVRVDERSAAFTALGLAKASGRPVPVPAGAADHADAHAAEGHGDGHGIHMPSPSIFPLIAALGLPIVAFGLIYTVALVPVGAMITIVGLYGWALEPAAE